MRARGRARRGLQTEVLVSLTVVMVTATGVLAALLARTHEAHLAQLRELAARALVAEVRASGSEETGVAGIRWWTLAADGEVRARGAHGQPIDPASRALAAAAHVQGRALLSAGRVWEPLRLAAPEPDGSVDVAWLPASAPASLLAGLALGAVVVFSAFGLWLLRGGLVLPLQRLAEGARAIADGRLDARVPVDGVAETADVAAAFNEMAEALAARTQALEKAVADLRQSNRSLREARDGLDRAERLAAVGRLAAGVAHEVGNPMGALLAFLDLVQRDRGLSEQGRAHLGKAARQGERVRVILRELLDFSRPPRGVPGPVELPALCEETLDLVRAQRRYAGIDLRVEVEGRPPAALADRAGVAQIVLNLVLNAADALAARDSGERRVRVRVRPAPALLRAGADPEGAGERRAFDAVEVVVEDSGAGVAPEDRERIFDPFFTTKPPGEGTGLGLSNALRIAERFGGRLDLDVRHERGAAFVLRLPAATPAQAGVRDA